MVQWSGVLSGVLGLSPQLSTDWLSRQSKTLERVTVQ